MCYGVVMPRKSRIDAPGAMHHLIARGIERYKIFRAVRDLGIGMAQIARRLNLSLAGVSQSVKRGETIVQQKGYNLIDP